jgi:hypothetical protein
MTGDVVKEKKKAQSRTHKIYSLDKAHNSANYIQLDIHISSINNFD